MAKPKFQGWVRVARSRASPFCRGMHIMRSAESGSAVEGAAAHMHLIRAHISVPELMRELDQGPNKGILIDDRLRVWRKSEGNGSPPRVLLDKRIRPRGCTYLRAVGVCSFIALVIAASSQFAHLSKSMERVTATVRTSENPVLQESSSANWSVRSAPPSSMPSLSVNTYCSQPLAGASEGEPVAGDAAAGDTPPSDTAEAIAFGGVKVFLEKTPHVQALLQVKDESGCWKTLAK